MDYAVLLDVSKKLKKNNNNIDFYVLYNGRLYQSDEKPTSQ